VSDEPINNSPKNRGQFQKGHSGNGGGRPKGSKNRSTLLFEGLLDKSGAKLIRVAIELALGGDSAVLRALLPLLLPPRKERPVAFPLPPIESAEDALRASETILAGAANGALAPSEAADLARLLEGHAKIYELHALEARIRECERERGIGAPIQ
jgi:hypothetical protein